MSRKRKKKKKKRRSQHRPRQKDRSVTISEYAITPEPIEDKDYEKLPSEIQDQIGDIIHRVHRNPKQVIPYLESLIETYPDIPQFYNFLAASYSSIGDREKANEIALKNYERNPDYLFAKCNYAEMCLEKGEIEKIPVIFNNKFDLKTLYPARKEFHISEATAFMGVIGAYFYKIGETQAVETYYGILKRVAPRHHMTKRLKRLLHPSLTVRLLSKLAEMASEGGTES